MTSSGPTSSSSLSITMPSEEYSRMELVSRMLLVALTTGPVILKAMILRLSGSIIGLVTLAIGPLAWTLKTGVPISLEFVTNIS